MKPSRLLVLALLSVAACGPTVEIVAPKNGETVTDSTTVSIIKFTAPARTFTIALDGQDQTSRFFTTEKTSSGTLSGLSNGQHVLQVDYVSKVGFSDTAESVFAVAAQIELKSLTISPSPVSLLVGGTAQLAVTGFFSDGTTQNLTGSAQGTSYASSAANVAAITSEGLITAGGAGTAIITATNQAVSAQITVTVTSTGGAPTPTPAP